MVVTRSAEKRNALKVAELALRTRDVIGDQSTPSKIVIDVQPTCAINAQPGNTPTKVKQDPTSQVNEVSTPIVVDDAASDNVDQRHGVTSLPSENLNQEEPRSADMIPQGKIKSKYDQDIIIPTQSISTKTPDDNQPQNVSVLTHTSRSMNQNSHSLIRSTYKPQFQQHRVSKHFTSPTRPNTSLTQFRKMCLQRHRRHSPGQVMSRHLSSAKGGRFILSS